MKIAFVPGLMALFHLLVVAAYGQNNEFPDSTILLREVVVDAYQLNTRLHHIPGSISVLSGNEIYTADGNNFASTLHSMPGIYMHSGTYATSRIVIRGVGSRTPYNTNRIKAYLNDIPITSSDGISTLEDIDLADIGQMEVIKGPASALYGSGLGGSMNLYTPLERENSVKTRLQYGSFDTFRAGAKGNLRKGDINIHGSINHLHSDGYRENNRLRRTSLLSAGSWTTTDHTLEYTLLWMDMYAGIPSSIGKTLFETNPQAAAPNWKDVEGYKKYQRAIAGVSLASRISTAWSNRLTAFGRWVDSYEKRPFNDLDDDARGGGIRNRLTYHAGKWDAVLGLEWIADRYRWQLDLDNERINKNTENRFHTNIFGMVYYRPAARWNISLGGALNKIFYRLTDEFPENGDQSGNRSFPLIFSPRIGINYAPSDNVAFYVSAGHGFSMPSPEETLLPEGDINNDIQPEQGVQYEAGVRLNFSDNATQIEATVYRIDLNNLLVTKRLTEDIFTGINAGKTRHAGVEVMLGQRVFRRDRFPGSLYVRANYTYSHNTFIDFTDDGNLYDGKTLPGIPSHIAQATTHWTPWKPFGMNVQFQYVSKQYINDANTLRSAAYLVGNLTASYRFFTGEKSLLEVLAGINNFTNAHYASMLTVNAVAPGNTEPRYYYPGLPRHGFVGVVWSF